MADSSSTKTPPAKAPVLAPQGEHAGKPAMPLGHHQFTLIGSRNRAHLHLLSSTISRNHACIVSTKSGMYVRDLASRTGVIVNGRKVREIDLQDGDLLQVGSFKFKLQEPAGAIHLATTPRPALAMLEMDGGALTPLDERTILIGRRPNCDISLDSTAVSNTHAIIFESDGRRYIRDLGSRTGTQVNGQTVHQQVLEFGDVIGVGNSRLRYVAADVPVAEAVPDEDAIALEAEIPEIEAHEEPALDAIGLDFDDELPAHPADTSIPTETGIPVAAEDTVFPVEEHAPAEAETIPLPAEPDTIETDQAIPFADSNLTASVGGLETADELGLNFWTPSDEGVITAEAPAAPLETETVEPVHVEVEPTPAAEAEAIPLEFAVEEPLAEAEIAPDPTSEEVPFVEDAPVVDEAPIAEPTANEAAPAAEEAPVMEAAPPIEDRTPVEEAPVVHETAVAETFEVTPPEEVTSDYDLSSAKPEELAVESGAPAAPEVAEAAAAPEEPEPVSSADTVKAPSEPVESDADRTDELVIAPLLEPLEIQAQDESAPAEPAAPLRVEDVDLSTVTFGAEIPESEPLAEVSPAAPEPATAAPLLDLVPPATADEPPAVVEPEPVPVPAKGRKPRAPRKKQEPKPPGAARRGRRKGAALVEAVVDSAAAAAAASAVIPVAEIAAETAVPVEAVPAIDTVSPTAASELTAASPVPSELVVSETSTAEEASEATMAEPAPVEPETTPAVSELTAEDIAVSETPVLESTSAPTSPEITVTTPVDLEPPISTSASIELPPEPTFDFVPEPSAVVDAIPAEPAEMPDIEPVFDEPVDRTPAVEDAGPTSPDLDLQSPAAETIEVTEPTVESALDLDPPLANIRTEGEPIGFVDEPANLSDTAFGRAVQDFSGSGLGPLVEESPAAAEAPTFSPIEAEAPVPVEAELPAPELPLEISVAPLPETEQTLTSDTSFEQAIELDLTPPLASEITVTSDDEIEPAIDLESSLDESTAPALADETSLDTPMEFEELSLGELGTEAEPPAAEAEAEPFELPAEPEAPAVAEAAGPAAEPVVEAPEPTPAAATPPPNPFYGMYRDLGSFIGGMPLPLSGAAAAAEAAAAKDAAYAAAPVIPEPQAPPAVETVEPSPAAIDEAPADVMSEALTPVETVEPAPEAFAEPEAEVLSFPEEPADEFALDESLFEGEEPLELFDETADQLDALPDSFEPIADVSHALAEEPQPQAKSTAPAAPAVPPGPAANSKPNTLTASAPPAAPVQTQTASPPVSLRSLTADPTSAKPLVGTAAVTVPPFAGSTPSARKGVNAFAGMSVPKVGGTDVFSQTEFPPLDDAAFRPQPIPIPPARSGAPPVPPPPASGAAAAKPSPWQPPPGGLAAAGAPRPSTGGKSTAVAPPPEEEEERRRRPWWKSIRHLLPLLIGAIAVAAVLILHFMAPKVVVQGELEISGLDKLPVMDRKAQILDVRELLLKPDFRTIVAGNLQEQDIPPGFSSDLSALNELANPSNSPSDGRGVVLRRVTNDPATDSKRMRAVLLAVYRESQTRAERAPQAGVEAKNVQSRVDANATELDKQKSDIEKLSNQIKAVAGTSAQELLVDPNLAVETLSQQDAQLRQALDKANADVKAKHDAWEQAQSAVTPGTAIDPKVAEMKQKLAAVNARLSVAKMARDGQIDQAKTFDDALQTVDQELTLIGAASSTAKLSAYVKQAREAVAEIRQLIARQKQAADTITELRRQIAERREAYLGKVWASDETLKELLEERDAQAHRFSAASDSGYAADAEKIRGVFDDLDQKIDARRQSLASGAQYADDLQQKLEQAIERVESDRQRNDQLMTKELALLDVPPASALPLGEQSAMSALGEQVAAVKAEHDQYALGSGKLSPSEADAQVRKLEAQATEQQAQLDGYEQRPDPRVAVTTARQALDAAQEAEARAQSAYTANLNLLSFARELKDAVSHYGELMNTQSATKTELSRQNAAANEVPVVLPPDERSVQIITEPDQRAIYLAGAILVLLAVFGGLMWMASRGEEQDVPYALISSEQGDLPTSRAVVGRSGMSMLEDEEHPAVA